MRISLPFLALVGAFCLLSTALIAQPLSVATPTTTPSTCSANGTLTLTVNNGTNNLDVLLAVTPPTYSGSVNFVITTGNTITIGALPAGVYTVRVTDATNQATTVQATVAGNYTEPTLDNCVIPLGTSSVTLTARDGLPPLLYAYSSNGGATFPPPSATNTFTCLPNGTAAFRVYDACNNFYPCFNTVNVLPLEFQILQCTNNSTAGVDFTCGNITGGEAPYVYTCSSNVSAPQSNSTGIFTGVVGCTFTITLTDKCSRVKTITTTCNAAPLTATIVCSENDYGSATVVANGGVPPYLYTETTFGATSTTGVFPVLSGGVPWRFYITDACGNSVVARISILRLSQNSTNVCPFTGTIDLLAGQNREDAVCGYGSFNTNTNSSNFYPVTFTCTNCTPQQTITVNNANACASPATASFTNLAPGGYTFSVVNACGESEGIFVNLEKIPLLVNGVYNCAGDTLIAASATAGTTFTLTDSLGVFVGSNTTGIFLTATYGTYTVVATNSTCLPGSTVVAHTQLRPQINIYNSCDSAQVSVVRCGKPVLGYTFTVTTNTNALIGSNTTGTFGGLTLDKVYKVVATAANGSTIQGTFKTYSLSGIFQAANTCSSITVSPSNITGTEPNNLPITYTLFSPGNVAIQTNTTGVFTGLPSGGSYYAAASHPRCGTVRCNVGTLFVPLYTYCMSPNNRATPNGGCTFAWTLAMNGNASFYKVINTATNDTLLGALQTQLPPSTYRVITECTQQTITLPKPPFNLTLQASRVCSAIGSITPSGARNSTDWNNYLAASGGGLCNTTDTYECIAPNGASLGIIPYGSAFVNNIFAGSTYTVYLISGGCRVDTAIITIPYYVRPDVTASFGAVCAGANTGSVNASIAFGIPPYTFELYTGATASGAILQTQTSNATTATFGSLPIGVYTLRAYDACGVSSDYATNVGALAFTPRAQRTCNGGVNLSALPIANATYIWTNSAGTVVGNAATTAIPNVSAADTYTVAVVAGTCTYNTSVAVAVFVPNNIVANAGQDVFSTTNTATLNATPLVANAVGVWTTVAPSTGTVNIASPSNPTSGITVSAFPGNYTFVWTVTDNITGCILSDTVKGSFNLCAGITQLTATDSVTNKRCNTLGTIRLTQLTGGVPPYTIIWNGGANTPTITNLQTGVYTATINDNSTCSAPLIRTFTIIDNAIPINNTVNVPLCPARSFTVPIYNTVLSAYGLSTGYRFTNTNGCDSIVKYNLFAAPTLKDTVAVTRCTGRTFTVPIYNNVITTAGFTAAYNYPTANGCDSLITYQLSFANAVYTLDTLRACNQITFKSIVYTNTTTVNDTLVARGGCDSIITKLLFIKKATASAVTLRGCLSLTYRGTTYTNDTQIVTTLTNSIGCDSIVTTNVVISTPVVTTVIVTDCGRVTYQGRIYTTDTTLTDTLVGQNVCYRLLRTNIVVKPLPIITFTSSNDLICNKTTATLTATGGVNYNFGAGFNFNTTFVATNTGTYTVTVTSANACTNTASLDVVRSTNFVTIDSLQVRAPTCKDRSDGSVTAFVSTGTPLYTYVWHNATTQQATLMGLGAGVYSVTVTDANGCTAVQSAQVTAPLAITAKALLALPKCYGEASGTVTITDIKNINPLTTATYRLDAAAFARDSIFTNVRAGIHTVAVQDANGCEWQTTFTLKDAPEITVTLSTNVTIKLGETVVLRPVLGSPELVTYVWSPVAALNCGDCRNPIATPTQTTAYTVTVTNALGCTASDDILITILNAQAVYIPNTFTPNSDGINDVLTLYANASVAHIVFFDVFDRWGTLVYRNTNFPSNGATASTAWDGTYKGKVLQTAVFVYHTKVVFKDGTEKVFVGDVTLVQ